MKSLLKIVPEQIESFKPTSNKMLHDFLNGLPGVDKVGAEERVAKLGTRSIKTTAKAEGIDLSIRMIDLTTLEGMDTKAKLSPFVPKQKDLIHWIQLCQVWLQFVFTAI